MRTVLIGVGILAVVVVVTYVGWQAYLAVLLAIRWSER